MNIETTSNLFMLPPETKYAGLYQELLKGVSSYRHLANRLIQMGEQAHALRQFDKVKEIGLLLSNIPLKDYQPIGIYFLAVAANSKGNGDQDEAKRLFELVVNAAPDTYKAKAILSLGALSFHKGDFDAALYFYKETIKAGKLSAATIQAIKTINVVKALEGYHSHALKDLERFLPAIRFAPPHTYFDYLNSYAVELGASGRIYEARNVIHHVLESPFAIAYPEWRDTEQELRPASRSFVVPRPKRVRKAKILRMPERDISGSITGPLADVIGMAEWKDKMGKGKKGKGNGDRFKPPDKMSGAEMVVEIMRVCIDPKTSDAQRRMIYAEMVRVLTTPPKDDDEDDDPAS